ncbi:uncharacterized protein LOC130196993 [Pseudoliparis swirei]|uniref:uncharacterized protein LOC130196993 n=1 Tax=Pseudoliparis swirei TaxID=2059687 RepID=UPI0024BE9583|nr:uncharacterized protein LOC130196993 [Pseudoliparis swirei]
MFGSSSTLMVAPMPAAGRLSWFFVLFAVIFIYSSLAENGATSVLVYDFLTLFNIRASVLGSLSHRPEQWSSHRHLHRTIPGGIWKPSCSCTRPRKSRRRSRRAGSAVRLREQSRGRSLSSLHAISNAAGPCRRLSCLRPVLPASTSHLPAFAPVPHHRAHSRISPVPGGNVHLSPTSVTLLPACERAGRESRPRWLQPLPRASTFGRAGSDRIDIGLINARSIKNKSFVLKDLFVTRHLDFLHITESWQKSDDFTSLNELCPQDCSYSCAPRASGSGGGLATIYRSSFHSRTVNYKAYSSFEILINKVGRTNPFLCVLVYRPPGKNRSFLADFGDFLASIIRYDRILMLGTLTSTLTRARIHSLWTSLTLRTLSTSSNMCLVRPTRKVIHWTLSSLSG